MIKLIIADVDGSIKTQKELHINKDLESLLYQLMQQGIFFTLLHQLMHRAFFLQLQPDVLFT